MSSVPTTFKSSITTTTPPVEIRRQRRVALIGSSGGGTATLGHTDPLAFLRIIQKELCNINDETISLGRVLFVSLDGGKGLDAANEKEDYATLYHMSDETQQQQYYGTLQEVNQRVIALEMSIADDIKEGKIHGLISVSCKVTLFHHTLDASSEMKIPVTGTGGTSLSLATAKYKLLLVGNAGGSVATTSLTRAISYTYALAQFWKLTYAPWATTTSSPQQQNNNTDKKPTWTSVLNSCLPAFWGVCLCKRFLLMINMHTKWLQEEESTYNLLLNALSAFALPTTCAVVMANSRRNSPNVLMAAVIASMVCKESIIGGLLAGCLVAYFEEHLLYLCILRWSIPATMTNLITTGFVGTIVAMLLSPIIPYFRTITHLFRTYLIPLLAESSSSRLQQEEEDYYYYSYDRIRLVSLFIIGCLFCYGSKIGWYHSIFLPIILIEMELGDASLLGAMDELTLVLVSAGICAGNLVVLGGSGNGNGCNSEGEGQQQQQQQQQQDVALMKRGLYINALCGDFIEVCYPLMEQHILINLAGYLASGWSVALLSTSCKSSAYLPFPLAIWLADDWKQLLFASFVAMGIPFMATILNHILFVKKLSSSSAAAASSSSSKDTMKKTE